MTAGNGHLQARRPEGGTPVLDEWGGDSECGVLRDVLLGPVESFHWMDDNAAYSSIVRDTLRKGHRFDKQLAMRQHREVVEAYEDAGVTVHFLGLDETTPYQVYARDSSVMTPYGAVICQLANPRRRGEYASCIRFYVERGIPIYDMVSAGNFEGGDFNIIAPGCVLIGYTGFRGEEVAARQVGGWFEREGWEEKLAAVCLDTTEPEVVDWLKAKGIEILPVSFQDTMTLGCNVMALGGDRVLSTAQSTDLNERLRALGFTVYDPDISMFAQAGGGVHCMSQPLRRDPG
jgi:N-dimethylarginine dimethylaminohydrolase